jgi:hypothetical protein
MITEDYVSFEVAKLLKEKGCYLIASYVHYDENGTQHTTHYPMELNIYDKPVYTAPTLQMAMKWLREVHNLVIEPYRTACGYLYTISSIPYGSTKYDNSQAFNGDDEDSGQWSTWEKACEDGVKYCLENLI